MKRLNLLLLLILAISKLTLAQEVCNNGIDDDKDGFIDLNDSNECICKLNAVQLTSLIPNPDFENNTCHPTTCSPITINSICADDWNKFNLGSVDYLYDSTFNLPNYLPQPFPSGKGAMGMCYVISYGEWPAVNLTAPLKAGETYTLNFDITGGAMDDALYAPVPVVIGKVDFYLYGSSSNKLFPLVGIGCPDASYGFEPLGKVTYDATLAKWTNLSITLTPNTDINSIAFGSACDFISSVNALVELDLHQLAYFAVDNFTLKKEVLVSTQQTIDENNGLICDKNKILIAHPAYKSGYYQWYKEGVAIVAQTDSVLKIPELSLGNGNYSFKSAENSAGDSCIVTSLKIQEDDLCKASYTWPNVFTPNGDGYNEYFTPKLSNEANLNLLLNKFSSMEFEVYDRWGERVFNSKNEWPKWDGKFNGELTSSGTYYYIFKYYDSNNNIHFENGYAQSIH